MRGMNLLRVLVGVVVVAVSGGCGEKSEESEGSGGNDGSATMVSSSAPTEASETPTTTMMATGAEEAEGSGSGGIADMCPNRPGGDWNPCFVDGKIDNDNCEWTMGEAGTPLCLSPTTGAFNVCGIKDCVDDCDCFAAPKTGDAIPYCDEVFTNGGRGCVLWCANGQTCPDGMECVSGTCYWPN